MTAALAEGLKKHFRIAADAMTAMSEEFTAEDAEGRGDDVIARAARHSLAESIARYARATSLRPSALSASFAVNSSDLSTSSTVAQ